MPRLGRHAVDAPVGFAVLVTDCDGEAAVVGADDVEVEASGAGNVKAGVLAGVLSLVQLAQLAARWHRLCKTQYRLDTIQFCPMCCSRMLGTDNPAPLFYKPEKEIRAGAGRTWAGERPLHWGPTLATLG